MKIGTYDIQPISIYLPDEQKWVDRVNESKKYFESIGLNDIYYVCGVHAENFGIKSARPYRRDVPDTEWTLEPRTVGNFLSVYMIFNIMWSHPEIEHFCYIEDDTRFIEGWREKLENALLDVPPDFDWLFVSHCCTEGRETKHIAGNIYEIKYPQAGHVSIIARKALPILIENFRDAAVPADILLYDYIFKKLKVYAIKPRLAEQLNTHLPI